MGFQSGLSGLNSSSRNLDVIGNNVANAAVVGFKGSVTQFADVFAQSLSGGGATQIGIGSKVLNVAQTFNQGNVTPTGNPLDIAITGRGFFRLEDNGTVTYSRNGQFHLDDQGFVVNADNINVTGYGIDEDGNIIDGAPGPIRFDTSDIPPRVTTEFSMGVNLNSNDDVPTVPFSPTNTDSYNFSRGGTAYDSLGNAQALTLYFRKTAPGAWEVIGATNGVIGDANLGAGAGVAVPLAFDTTGALTTAMPLNVSMVVNSGATTPLAFTLDLSSSTQYGQASSINSLAQDGYTSGRLAGYNVSEDGIIRGAYTNGQSRNLGQIVLADFVNPQGLAQLGNNLWRETSASGQPIIGTPNSGTLGGLQSSAVEDSNVDLTAELVNMIVAQRIYQANAQTIKTQDQVLQTLVNIR